MISVAPAAIAGRSGVLLVNAPSMKVCRRPFLQAAVTGSNAAGSAADAQIARDRFEFQMLYGIRRDLQKRLVSEGYRVRVYIPYGKAWYPYFMRRLAERPANVLFLIRNLFR